MLDPTTYKLAFNKRLGQVMMMMMMMMDFLYIKQVVCFSCVEVRLCTKMYVFDMCLVIIDASRVHVA